MTARVIPLRSAEIIEFPRDRRKETLRELAIRRLAEWDAEEKLRIYERIIGGDDPEAA